MRTLAAVAAFSFVLLAAIPIFSQQIDPGLRGFWTLNVDKSDFGSRPKPKMGFVNWGEHGWTFAIVTAEGRLYADAVSTDAGCTLLFGDTYATYDYVSKGYSALPPVERLATYFAAGLLRPHRVALH